MSCDHVHTWSHSHTQTTSWSCHVVSSHHQCRPQDAPPLSWGMWAHLHGRKCEGSKELREGRNQGKRCVVKNELRFSSWLVFAVLIFHPPIPIYLLTVPPGQNDTRSPCYHHHLPRVQMRAGGGWFRHFDATPTTTTFLPSKREPGVVHLVVSTCIQPPPSPSRWNASWRWFISQFRRASHHHHCDRVYHDHVTYP